MLEKIQELVADGLGVDAAKVLPETSFKDDLGADSLDAMELNMALEEAFDITISEDALVNFKTVKDVVDYIDANK